MIRKLFILASIVCMAVSSVAQTVYTSAVLTDPNFTTVGYLGNPLCNWNDNYSVSYYIKEGKSYFCLIDHTEFVNTPITVAPPYPPTVVLTCPTKYAAMPLPVGANNSFVVSDIYIVDDYAFFCGAIYDTITGNTPRWDPMYGYFEITDFFSSSLNISLFKLKADVSIPPYPSNIIEAGLERLVVYPYGSSYKLVAYGKELAEYPANYHKIAVEIDDAMSGTSPCEMAYIPPVSFYLDDILLTDSYVTILSHDDGVGNYSIGHPWYSYASRSSVVDELLDQSHTSYIPVDYEANNTVIGVALPDDHFAMAYVHVDGDNPSIKYTNLRVININTGVNTISQQFKKPDKEPLVKMIYWDKRQKIELLQDMTDSSYFVRLNPYATGPYFTPVFNPGNKIYGNLQPLGDDYRFIASFGGRYYLQNMFYTASLCPTTKENAVVIIENEQFIKISPWYEGTVVITPLSTAGLVTSDILKTECRSYE